MNDSRKVLITGAPGFLGCYLRQEMEEIGCDVYTLSRSSTGPGRHVRCDLAGADAPPRFDSAFQWVVHAAGKAHVVPKTESERQSFYDVNVKGTETLLKALERAPGKPKAMVFISSVAVYGRETGEMIDEDAPLLASDPYGKSKIQAEELVLNWGRKHDVIVGVARLPLVAGADPPGNLGDMIRAIRRGCYFRVGNGSAQRSWVWAADVAHILSKIAQIGGVFNLSDGCHPAMADIEDGLARLMGKGPVKSIPVWLAKSLALAGDVLNGAGVCFFPFNTRRMKKMNQSLTFSDQKARRLMGWNPTNVIHRMDEVFLESCNTRG